VFDKRIMAAKRVGIIGFDGVTALDIVGPLEAFAAATCATGKNTGPCYEVITIGLTEADFLTESGLALRPHKSLHTAPALDTLILPGGSGLRRPEINRPVAEWVKRRAARTRRVVCVCTGIYGLAPTGLLDHRRVTTHWRFARDVAQKFPKLKLDDNAMFLRDGKFHTSAGITAGIDLSLSLIEEDFGREVALDVARELVVYLKRPGGQDQYAKPLEFEMEANDAMSELAVWMAGHLDKDVSIKRVAKKACLTRADFNRLFKRAFGITPGAFVKNMRLNEARRLLSLDNDSIAGVAQSVGFRSAQYFVKAFEWRFGVLPGDYRQRFSLAVTSIPHPKRERYKQRLLFARALASRQTETPLAV
jgi:transcriptional regulator GlxA family with amidase domain